MKSYMKNNKDVILAYSIMLGLIILVGFLQSWSIALSILCFCLISAVMTIGANIQWGYAGLINFGIMGYTALGGLAAVLVSVPPVQEAWQAVDIQLRDEMFDTWNKRNRARKSGDTRLAEQLNTKYKELKKQAIAEMKARRATYGEELDEYGNPDPESYGRAEIKQELAVEKQIRGVQ